MQHTMSSKKRGGKAYVAGTADSASKGNGMSGGSSPKVDQISHGVANISLDSAAQDGEWEVYIRRSKNKAGGSSAKSWGTQNSSSKAWEHLDVAQKLGKRKHGWNWAVTHPSDYGTGKKETHLDPHSDDDDDGKIANDIDSDAVDSDDELLSDEYDSDVSEKSHESRKKSKWFIAFFEILDKLTVEVINEPDRQWHCPACRGGPGAIDWYPGLQPLMTHAKTKGSNRVKLHREFAGLLDEEMPRRGTSVIPAGEAYGKWKGLNETVKDRKIVWPPMVIIMNTWLEQDESDKWIGMGNQELLDYFSSYNPVRARHSYGPQGHRGMSILIFENSAMGYVVTKYLHNHFREQGTYRDAWDQRRVLFYPGGIRQLYGYMAEKRDLDIFNQHCHGISNSRLKFELRSYQEMVVDQMKQMNEDNQELILFKDRVAKWQRQFNALKRSFGLVSEKLRKTSEESRIVQQRSKIHHDQNKEEMDFQDLFWKDQIQIIAKGDSYEKIQQEEREKVKSSLSTNAGRRHRVDEMAKFIKCQEKEMEEFVAESEKLIKLHEDKIIALKQKYLEEEIELEKEF
ncbi:XS domain-containing protein [Actinidia rufa]|uniref:XS domain-containing protein n=1 Tax=Actinidia rufa TaxID=165716 RepID=A0A7J0H7H7_9ERIC|nr:XS domain-containing protein [Actinidia rufa]